MIGSPVIRTTRRLRRTSAAKKAAAAATSSSRIPPGPSYEGCYASLQDRIERWSVDIAPSTTNGAVAPHVEQFSQRTSEGFLRKVIG
jgi:hypothetical protein